MIGRHHLRADAVRPDNEAGGEAVARHVLSLGHRQVAVTAGAAHLTTIADRLAGVHRALREHGGVSVPGQVSVAGFDDVAVAADLAPGLTTVRLPMSQMGELALTMALEPRSSRPRRKATGHELLVRDSTGPVPPPAHTRSRLGRDQPIDGGSSPGSDDWADEVGPDGPRPDHDQA